MNTYRKFAVIDIGFRLINLLNISKMQRILFFLLGLMISLNVCSQEKLVNANNSFAFKIYKSTIPDTSNFFISPFSLNIALSIANEGAKSTTRTEIDNLLFIHDSSHRDVLYNNLINKTINLHDSDYYRCIEWQNSNSDGNTLYLANSLWINSAFSIDKKYKQTIQEKYYSEFFAFNKNNISAADQEINNWISKKTHFKIKEISGLNPDAMLCIINAIYFQGEWESSFDKDKTKKKNFSAITKGKIKIDFMNDKSNYRYFEDDDLQALFLPYTCDQFSMIVLLPQEKYGIEKIESMMSPEYMSTIEQTSAWHEVILSLPKFRIETELFLKDHLIRMGFGEMFSDKADFSGISERDSLKIEKIIHKTFIEIDEVKTEAAAVSKIEGVLTGYSGGDPPPVPKIFNANHPFAFLIIDNRTNAIIFIGRFVR